MKDEVECMYVCSYIYVLRCFFKKKNSTWKAQEEWRGKRRSIEEKKKLKRTLLKTNTCALLHSRQSGHIIRCELKARDTRVHVPLHVLRSSFAPSERCLVYLIPNLTFIFSSSSSSQSIKRVRARAGPRSVHVDWKKSEEEKRNAKKKIKQRVHD